MIGLGVKFGIFSNPAPLFSPLPIVGWGVGVRWHWVTYDDDVLQVHRCLELERGSHHDDRMDQVGAVGEPAQREEPPVREEPVHKGRVAPAAGQRDPHQRQTPGCGKMEKSVSTETFTIIIASAWKREDAFGQKSIYTRVCSGWWRCVPCCVRVRLANTDSKARRFNY